MVRAEGSRKWDVDNNEFIDFAMGHGSLLLGHGHPEVVRAVEEAARNVMHASAPTPLEVSWADLVTSMVPGADEVRFVLSGTEATMLAIRVARAFTDRSILVKLQGHFHGWHDSGMVAYAPPFEIPSSAGVPAAVQETVRAIPSEDSDALEGALGAGDVAAVILEPDGAIGGQVPLSRDFLSSVREKCTRAGVVLIFDEVITGFRLAPGGAQEFLGIQADLCTYAKAISGGMPSGAVTGRRDLMERIAFRDDADWNRTQRVRHQGTFNAFPVAAAAGVAALPLLQSGAVQDRAAAMADRLRAGFNRVLKEHKLPGCAYGDRSIVRLILGPDLPQVISPQEFLRDAGPLRLLEGVRQPWLAVLQRALLLEGLDFLGGTHGYVSAAHSKSDIDRAVVAFGQAIDRVQREIPH